MKSFLNFCAMVWCVLFLAGVCCFVLWIALDGLRLRRESSAHYAKIEKERQEWYAAELKDFEADLAKRAALRREQEAQAIALQIMQWRKDVQDRLEAAEKYQLGQEIVLDREVMDMALGIKHCPYPLYIVHPGVHYERNATTYEIMVAAKRLMLGMEAQSSLDKEIRIWYDFWKPY